MKFSWKTAPIWAKYLAQDQTGQWWWFEKHPKPPIFDDGNVFASYWLSAGKRLPAKIEDTWLDSLHIRPSTKKEN